MQYQLVLAQDLKEAVERKLGERIKQSIFLRNADLDEAKFFRIRMQTVRLRIQGDPLCGRKLGQKCRQLFIRIDHGREYKAICGRQKQKLWLCFKCLQVNVMLDDFYSGLACQYHGIWGLRARSGRGL
jgi:hypothetical protein